MAELNSALTFSGRNSWTEPGSRLSWDEEKSLMDQLTTAAKEGGVHDIIQMSLRILSADHLYNNMIRDLSGSLSIAFLLSTN